MASGRMGVNTSLEFLLLNQILQEGSGKQKNSVVEDGGLQVNCE